jgi:type IV pilus assembly protein PilA
MVVVAIIGILAAIAIPNFLRYQATSRQAEARTNLGGIYVTEVAYFGESGRYGSFDEVGYGLSGAANRYTYRSPATGGAAGSTNADYIDRLPAGIAGNTPENSVVASGGAVGGAGLAAAFTATATGNVDADVTPDEWHVNDLKRNLQTPDRNDVTS